MSGEKRVTVDLGVEMSSSCLSAHPETRLAWAERALAAEGTWGLEKESVKSSAYEVVSCGDCG